MLAVPAVTAMLTLMLGCYCGWATLPQQWLLLLASDTLKWAGGFCSFSNYCPCTLVRPDRL